MFHRVYALLNDVFTKIIGSDKPDEHSFNDALQEILTKQSYIPYNPFESHNNQVENDTSILFYKPASLSVIGSTADPDELSLRKISSAPPSFGSMLTTSAPARYGKMIKL
jgi:hypothetical protein